MPHVSLDGLELCYETAGDPAGAPVLLVAGLGVQLIDWPNHFIAPLVDDGHYVIRYDNRDIGLSTSFPGLPSNTDAVIEAVLSGEAPNVGYTLADMATDAARLLTALGIDQAHVIGASMGGMIAQRMAIDHAARVRSLTSIMSTTGDPEFGQPTPEAMQALLTPPPADDRATRIAHGLEMSKIWGSPDHLDMAEVRRSYEASWDRVGGVQTEGIARQLCATVAGPARDEQLRSVVAPTLVIHGTEDTLITPSGGQRTAACIPHADLVLVQGMGHDLPEPIIDQITDPIRTLISTTESRP